MQFRRRRGPAAQAQELVLELRKRYKLAAYTHKVQFKLDDPNGPAGPTGKFRWQYQRCRGTPTTPTRSGDARNTRCWWETIRPSTIPRPARTWRSSSHLEPDCLNVDKGKPTFQTLAALRHIQEDIKQHLPGGGESSAARWATPSSPPIRSCRATTTPPRAPSAWCLRMNRGVTHSLLDCPGKYTVQVAHFSGTTVFDQRQIEALETGKGRLQSTLTKACEEGLNIANSYNLWLVIPPPPKTG